MQMHPIQLKCSVHLNGLPPSFFSFISHLYVINIALSIKHAVPAVSRTAQLHEAQIPLLQVVVVHNTPQLFHQPGASCCVSNLNYFWKTLPLWDGNFQVQFLF
ncbi:hypothetical protein DUNSADRAFT_4950 [Dunaliella salina]|uniref:Encoded protein n=1 Tax=Dunaliella salina TaxID=3046 RepID=A0ABQ7GQY8_DUNSA|nr:hypothetical protein DUNSADRAFT_4950 [Dunaliella salina]|eukprot:KAF5837025.1 hypothetical protein DUNSADRAFT_4950 [Dunaliella salina]